MSQLLYIRHAQASLLKADYDQLSDLGYQQSTLLGHHLAKQEGVFDKVYIGPLKRHLQTMEKVMEVYQVKGIPWPEPIILPELAEHHGPETMKIALPDLIKHDTHLNKLSNVKADSPELQKKIYLKMFEYIMELWAEGTFEVPEMQTWAAFRKQAIAGLNIITETAEGNGLKIAAFTSGGTTAATLGHVMGMNDESKIIRLNSIVQNTSLTHFLFSGKKITLKSFNHVPHLIEKEMITFV